MTIDVNHYRELCSHLGKFEAEEPQTPYFHELMDEGEDLFTDFEEGPVGSLFETEAEEREVFNIGNWLLLWEDSQGFAYSQDFYSREEAEAFWEEMTS